LQEKEVQHVRFQDLTAPAMNMAVFWVRIVEFLDVSIVQYFLKHNVSGTGYVPVFNYGRGVSTYSAGSVRKSWSQSLFND
jgi:hypothetical protein